MIAKSTKKWKNKLKSNVLWIFWSNEFKISTNRCTILELSHFLWYPYPLWKQFSCRDVFVLQIFSQSFQLQCHLWMFFTNEKSKIIFNWFWYHLVPFPYILITQLEKVPSATGMGQFPICKLKWKLFRTSVTACTIDKDTFSAPIGIFYVRTEIWKEIFQKKSYTTA